MTIDRFLDRMPHKGYNCLDFAAEVWFALSGGVDIRERLTGLVGQFAKQGPNVSWFRQFERLSKPVSPCFVVMQRFRFTPHVGIFLDGRILHMTDRGVQFQPLVVARAYFSIIRYYR
jgi:hypothetical protein